MKMRRALSYLLTFMLLVSSGIIPSSAETPEEAYKGRRSVGVHAQSGENANPENISKLYVGESANIYLSIDAPNKGDRDSSGKHLQPHFDLNGYSVKFYYDTDYFELDAKTPDKPINYKLSEIGADDTVIKDGEEVPVDPGYYPRRHAAKKVMIDGKEYQCAWITVFFSGSYLPDNKDQWTAGKWIAGQAEKWYNLCALPIKPIKTGATEVFIEVGTADEFSLELFSKNSTDPDETRKNFELDVVNGGSHTIHIGNQLKPNRPIVTPPTGTYPVKQEITISQVEDCDVFYSLNGGPEELYDGPFEINSDTVLVCYAKYKTGDKRESGRVTHTYTISPEMPYLFESNLQNSNLVTNEYYKNTEGYKVYFSDTADMWRDIPAGTEIYFTYREDIAPEVPQNPETSYDKANEGWVQVNKQIPYLEIDKPVTVRMFSDKLGTISEVNSYKLGFMPSEVCAKEFNGTRDYPSDVYSDPIIIRLETSTPGAEIFYTLDNSSPLNEVNRYDPDVPIVINGDTILRAVSKVDGKYGPVMTNWYVIENDYEDYGVDAFYPSGKYEGEVIVTLTPSNPEYTVQYKYAGDTQWSEYDKTKPLVITDDKVITARAVDASGNTDGSTHTFIYKILPKPPVFSSESTRFTNDSYITLYCEESITNEFGSNSGRYSLYYTTDGTWPITTPSDGSDPELIVSESVKQADPASDSAEILIDGYTVITAVVVKDGKYFSTVVQHSYNVVRGKPINPITTLSPGAYLRENGTPVDEKLTTLFLPVSANTEIYYTVSYDGEEYCPDPVANTDVNGTKHYDKNNPVPIEIKGNTTIKAVSVNTNGETSDVSIFTYTVTPETPFAPPSDTISGTTLPTVPVDIVPGSTIKYKIGAFENIVPDCGLSRIYIDTHTGTAYADPENPASILGTEGTLTGGNNALLEITATYDGVQSDTGYYRYGVSGADDGTLAAPYADKKSGRYDEVEVDDEGSLLIVRLYSINPDAQIEYKLNNSSDWILYNAANPIRLKDGDDILQARCFKGDGAGKAVSSVSNYTYIFYPIPPMITEPSGRYEKTTPPKQTVIKLDLEGKPHKPFDPVDKYRIWYRRNGDPRDYSIESNFEYAVDIDHTMSVKAYVENTVTKRTSRNVVRYYVVEDGFSSEGTVSMADPYKDKKRISAAVVTQKPYSDGIKLFTDSSKSDVRIYYTYKRTFKDGTWVETDRILYDPASPIAVTEDTKSIEIEAWLEDSNGEISNSRKKFDKIDFVTIAPPKPSLENESTIQFDSGKQYTILNDYSQNPLWTIYYTTNGSEPVTYDAVTGKAKITGTRYNGETLILNSDTPVKTVYRSACGTCYSCDSKDYNNCQKVIFGEIGSYRYVIKQITVVGGGGGGGGGSRTVDKTRKYTADIFGNEHPTHIGYIKGYPDGSVRPEGNITREEITAILYRIKNKAYDEPFTTSGEVYPDVKHDRWSVTEIEYMENQKVVEGYPDGEFKPSNKLTRAEFAAMICRFAKLQPKETENTFPDLKKEHWAYKNIMMLYSNGLIQGYEDKTFRPEREITRAEVMTVVNKILGRKPLDSYVKSLDFNPFNDLYVEKWYYVDVMEATITHNYILDKKEEYESLWEDCK